MNFSRDLNDRAHEEGSRPGHTNAAAGQKPGGGQCETRLLAV
ncbi:hypothetical protein [Streptomyces sp. NPDC051576]